MHVIIAVYDIYDVSKTVYSVNIFILWFRHVVIFFHFFPEKGETGLKQFVHFMTGTDEIPPLGMPQKIEVSFMNQSNFFAETCMFELKVPTSHEAFQEFNSSFLMACANHKGFGSV